MYSWNDGAYLMHHGIKGQKWGVRRYQNSDGSLTDAGRKRYGIRERIASSRDALRRAGKAASPITAAKHLKNKWNALSDDKKKTIKKAVVTGAAVAATALAAYGTYKYVEATKDKAYLASMRSGANAIDDILSRAGDTAWKKSTKEYWDEFSISGDQGNSLRSALLYDVHQTANQNSRSFKAARQALRGDRRYSIAELERSGIETSGAWFMNDRAKKQLEYYRSRDKFFD